MKNQIAIAWLEPGKLIVCYPGKNGVYFSTPVIENGVPVWGETLHFFPPHPYHDTPYGLYPCLDWQWFDLTWVELAQLIKDKYIKQDWDFNL